MIQKKNKIKKQINFGASLNKNTTTTDTFCNQLLKHKKTQPQSFVFMEMKDRNNGTFNFYL